MNDFWTNEEWQRVKAEREAEIRRMEEEGMDKEEKMTFFGTWGFILIGIPIILIISPYIIVTSLMLGSVGADAIIGAIRGIFH